MSLLRFGLIFASFALAGALRAADDYTLTPDSLSQKDVPKGKLEGPFEWKSKIFDGTTRQYWVYVPAKYDKEKAACPSWKTMTHAAFSLSSPTRCTSVR